MNKYEIKNLKEQAQTVNDMLSKAGKQSGGRGSLAFLAKHTDFGGEFVCQLSELLRSIEDIGEEDD